MTTCAQPTAARASSGEAPVSGAAVAAHRLSTGARQRRPASALRLTLQLCRGGLSFTVALASVCGGLLAGGAVQALHAGAGVLLLAAGCSALNQFQERDLDRLSQRTRNRPLPCGALRPRTALSLAIVLLAGGFAVLAAGARDAWAVGLAGLAVLLYNGVYTPLKRRSALAFVPGAVAGALPPLIGAAAAGAVPPAALVLAGTLFVWQMPHTWLLQLRSRSEEGKPPLPTFCMTLPPSQLRRLIFTWSVAFAALPPVLLLLLCGRLHPALPEGALLLPVVLIVAGLPLLGPGDGATLYRRLELLLRVSLLLVLLALLVLAGPAFA